MNLFIYNIVIGLYALAIRLVAPFNKKAGQWIDGRVNYFNNLQKTMYKNTAPVVWFHCASLGEFEQARPLVEKVREEHRHLNILVTFFSPSGYEIRKNYEKADYVFYLPLDTAFNARKFIRVVNPRIAFFVKYEFWYHYLHELHEKNIPAISFSTIFRDNQTFFKPYGGFFRGILRNFTHIFVQDNGSMELLKRINIHTGEIVGDTRFDRVKTICDNRKSFPLIEQFKEGKKLLVAGSTWKEDFDVLLPLIQSTPALKVILAPHEIDNAEIENIIQRLDGKAVRYSAASETNIASFTVLIIDNIGMLSSLYQYGEFAYIGGAFGKGLHNILEAATFGMPVFFGPKYEKFKEARDLVAEGAAISVKDVSELSSRFHDLYENEEKRKTLSAKSKSYVVSHTGATEKILNCCKPYLSK